MQVQIQVYKESNISVYVITILLVYVSLNYEIKWNTFYSDNALMCLIAIAAIT